MLTSSPLQARVVRATSWKISLPAGAVGNFWLHLPVLAQSDVAQVCDPTQLLATTSLPSYNRLYASCHLALVGDIIVSFAVPFDLVL